MKSKNIQILNMLHTHFYCKFTIHLIKYIFVRYVVINMNISQAIHNNKYTKKFKLLKTPGLHLASYTACSSPLCTMSPVYQSYQILVFCSSLLVEPIPNILLR